MARQSTKLLVRMVVMTSPGLLLVDLSLNCATDVSASRRPGWRSRLGFL